MKSQNFTEALLSWYRLHGRHDLPWQKDPTPYRVWVSEIMLQQTQVSTVIDYYQRFMSQFLSVKSLSEAELDQVLGLWSGLGYYARARNLHRCAQIIFTQYHGEFPNNVDQLSELPGIGRSTAGAILSFSMGVRAPILDGNVKRVLTRYHAIEGSPSESAVNKRLWDLAECYTPNKNFSEYNQAMMDLGATICTRRNPTCQQCPVMSDCRAFNESRAHEFPYSKKSKRLRPKKTTHLLMIKTSSDEFLFVKRPPMGIWGGLWSFPECPMGEDIKTWCVQHLHLDISNIEHWPAFNHTFTHFDLTIQPVLLTISAQNNYRMMESSDKIWYKVSEPLPGGIAAPVSQLLTKLKGVYDRSHDLLSKITETS